LSFGSSGVAKAMSPASSNLSDFTFL
jgi:hypothetical protein